MDLYQAITRYKHVGTREADTLFGWLYSVYRALYLPCTDPQHIRSLAELKTKLCIFDVLLDDLADDHKQRDWETLMTLAKIPFDRELELKGPYLSFGRELWESCMATIEQFPRFQEFRKIFYFDLRQVLLAIEYGYLVNEEGIGNRREDHAIHSHNCMVYLHSDLDLMCSPTFDKHELPKLREVLYLAQRVAVLGNALGTYAKELVEQDKSSPIIAEGLRQGVVSLKDLEQSNNVARLEARLKPLEGQFLHEARQCLQKICELAPFIKSVDVREVALRYEDVFEQYLAWGQMGFGDSQTLTTTGEFPAPIKHDTRRHDTRRHDTRRHDEETDQAYAALRSLLSLAK